MYTMYMGDDMKKTEFVTFRTTKETKDQLEKLAKEKEWTIAHIVDHICKDYLSNKPPLAPPEEGESR